MNLVILQPWNIVSLKRLCYNEKKDEGLVVCPILFYNTRRYQKTAALHDPYGIFCCRIKDGLR